MNENTVDSINLEYGPGAICARFPCFFFFSGFGVQDGQFQLLGFYCTLSVQGAKDPNMKYLGRPCWESYLWFQVSGPF